MKKFLLSIATVAMSLIGVATAEAASVDIEKGDLGSWGKEVTCPASVFADLKAGDKIIVEATNCGENPQVQLVCKLGEGWTWTEMVKFGDFVGGKFEWVMEDNAEWIASLKERGMWMKGQNATVVKVTVGEAGTPDNPDTPDNPGGDNSVDIEKGDLGSWDKEVTCPASVFANLKAGSKIIIEAKDCGENAQVQLVCKLGEGWTWTEMEKFGNFVGGKFEWTMPDNAEWIASLKERGMWMKGQNATVTKVTVSNGNGGDTPDNPGGDNSVDIEKGDLGEWSNEVICPASVFANLKAGSKIIIEAKDCGENPQVQLACKVGESWTWTEMVKFGDIVANKFEWTMEDNAEWIAALKERGMWLKGQHATVTKVTVSNGNSGVENVEIDFNAPVEIYTIQGVRVNEMTKGLYIVRQGNNVKKVMK